MFYWNKQTDAEWPIIKANCKDGSLDILVSSPKKTDDRLWIPTHNQSHMLKVAFALLTDHEKPMEIDNQDMDKDNQNMERVFNNEAE